jgi:benzoate-CoA ligase
MWPGPPKPQKIFEIIERHRPTLFFSVPSNYGSLLTCGPGRDHLETGALVRPVERSSTPADFDLSSIRHAVSAGEPLPAALLHRFKERFGVEILDAIGSTEILHVFIANHPGAVRPGSSGRIIDGYEARIVDEYDQPAKPGDIGNLLVKSDSTCSHYWNQHEKSKSTIEGHWIRTGDKYYQDGDGYFWYAGRSDDMLKCSGAWVSPIEIESVLVEHPAVQEAAVIGREDHDQLLKPAAYVILRNGTSSTPSLARELQEFVISRLPIFKRPRWVEFVDDLPKTATGKLQRYKLRDKEGKPK